MANHYTIRGGIDSTAVYKEEATYATNPGTWTANAVHFGLTQSVSPSVSRALARLRGLSGVLPSNHTTSTSRDAKQIVAGKTDLQVSVEYQPQDFSFLKYVVGSVSTSSSTHTYPRATAATEEDRKSYVKVPSFTLMEKFDFGGTDDGADVVFFFTGLKVDSWELNAALGEPCKCSATMIGSDITYDDTTPFTTYPYVALSAEDVYHFVDSDAKYGSTSIPNLLDGVTLTINNSAQGLGDMRSYVNEAVVVMGRDWTVKLNIKTENITQIKTLLGTTDGSGVGKPVIIETLNLVFDKGGNKNLTATLKNLRQADGFPQISYGDVAEESITLEAEFGYFVENATL